MPDGPGARIALIDYSAGNLTSVRKGFAAAGAEVVTPATPADLASARAVVVPGVSHFGTTAALTADWRAAIAERLGRGVPLLGICVGLQWLFEGSDEAPDVPGLGAIRGRCARLPPGRKVPHVGWNTLRIVRSSKLLRGVADGSFVYFTHSYGAPVTCECAATTAHGIEFASVVERDNVYGVQFHPEKSGAAGIRILTNFVAIAAGRDRASTAVAHDEATG
jgi:glutamine amidotransferase